MDTHKNKKPKSQAGYIGSFIIGAILAYFSYTFVNQDVERNKIILILTGPAAMVFLLISLRGWFPKFKGDILLAAGALTALGNYYINWEFLTRDIKGILALSFIFLIALIMIIIGISEIINSKKK